MEEPSLSNWKAAAISSYILSSSSSCSAILGYSLALNSFLCCMKGTWLLCIFVFLTHFTFSQTDSTKKSSSYNQQEDVALPPYKRFPTVPPLKLLLLDSTSCLLYTSDAADERSSVDLGG